MSELRNNYQNLTTEELLKRRALGEDGLSIQAHKVVEEILTERGIAIPPIPKRSINNEINKNKGIFLKILFFLIFIGFSEHISLTIGLSQPKLILISIIIYMIYYFVKKSMFSNLKELDRKRDRKEVSDLMYFAIKGDLDGVNEALNYSKNIDATDKDGTTALIYAIANKHNEIAKLLIMSGADTSIKTKSGRNAMYFAEKFNNKEIVKLL
jgi:ankyrin repeat protein